MPPRDETISSAMADPVVSSAPPPARSGSSSRPRSSSNKKPEAKERRSKSSSKQRGRDEERPRDDDNDDARAKELREKEKKKERKSKRKGGAKKKDKSKPSSQEQATPSPGHNNTKSTFNKSPPPSAPKEEGVTVSRFLERQRSMQDQASKRKNASLRQQMLHQQQQAAAIGSLQSEGEVMHHFDDEYSEERGAVVPRNNDANRAPPKVVDAVPADHPSSSIVQKYRTCSLCQRTLHRSQFSERDRYSVNLSIAPGATCRTCSMTVCAVKLKNMPGTEQLLLDYAQRGMQQGMLTQGGAVHNNNGAKISGLLEGSPGSSMNSSALVVRRRSSVGDGIVGKELTLYDAAGKGNDQTVSNQLAIPHDVNTAFSGRRYGQGDEERSSSVADCRYIDTMLRMPCYLNLNAFGLFTTSAEISVSLAALEAVRTYGTLKDGCFVPHDCEGMPVSEGGNDGKHPKGGEDGEDGEDEERVNPKSVVCLVLNEGPIPRTAILASQHYGWTTLAIDPSLSEDWDGYHGENPIHVPFLAVAGCYSLLEGKLMFASKDPNQRPHRNKNKKRHWRIM